jgi:uncharacterized protein YndB with AHSA1/START domain
MIRTIAIAVALLLALPLAGVLAFAATKPDSFRVERSATIAAPPERIFPLVSDFRQWRGWSPWEAKDPAMERTLSSPGQGVGAAYAWSGNGEVGAGRMEIVEAVAPARLAIRLDFERPMEAHNLVEFTFAGQSGRTEVTWAMHGPSPYLAKVMTLFFSMDRMVGGEFEAGLAKLKTLAEG